MNRHEHVEWCKDRALEYVERNDLTNAFASIASDLNKHEETSGHMEVVLGMGFRRFRQWADLAR